MSDYGNRTDLPAVNAAQPQPVRAASGQPYGARQQQEQAQQAIPLPNFDAPTARPHEPITAGMPQGPGPGPVDAGVPQAPAGDSQNVADTLRAIYAVYPTDDLLDLIATLDRS